MAKALDIVMDSRKALVDKIIDMMKAGYVFTAPEWDAAALKPYNPISKASYKGGNRMRLMAASIEFGYKDPRWMTAKQMASEGYERYAGEEGILCEKWIFEKKVKIQNPDGTEETVIKELNPPMVSFFVVYNAEQVKDFPPLEHSSVPDTEISEIVDTFKSTSECEIVEAAQPKAYYSYVEDKIILPPRLFFKDDISFAKTMFHEMAHSTGHKTRLDRDMMHPFGTPEYAKEELRAEIGALFVETDLGLCLAAEHYQDHSNYLASWIKMLQDDPNEFFRACGEAEKISQRLIGNYRERYPMPELEMLPEKKRPEKERPERVNQRGRKR